MKIWFQLLSPDKALARFITAVQQHVDGVVQPGTAIDVRGRARGASAAVADDYRLFWNYGQQEVIDNGLRIRKEGGYDAFVVANSMEPGIVELREMLDIPVVSFMEVNCFHACTMGERFGIVVPFGKMVSRYTEIPVGYGLRDRLATVEAIATEQAHGLESAFKDETVPDSKVDQVLEATRRCIAKGAEVVFLAGSRSLMMAQRGIYQLDGVPILDSYALLAKYAELAVTMHKLTGVCVSRHLKYKSPPRDVIAQVGHAYGIDLLKDG